MKTTHEVSSEDLGTTFGDLRTFVTEVEDTGLYNDKCIVDLSDGEIRVMSVDR